MADIDSTEQPQPGYQPPEQGYQPPPQGYQPPAQGYPNPKQPGYPPAQPGYPPTAPGAQTPPPPYPGTQPNPVAVAAPVQTVIVRTTQPTGPQPNDYLGFAIFVTICCCLPFGIVAIVKSMEVRNRHIAGDRVGAEQASQSAKSWSIASLVSGLVIVVIVIIVYAAAFATAFSSY